MTNVDAILAELFELADPERAAFLAGFFKTGPGGYGEGDRFLGIRVPEVRRLARRHRDAGVPAAAGLLESPWHEARLLGLLVLVGASERGDAATREAAFRLYLDRTDRIDNWDLVDVSAPHVVGRHLADGADRSVLDRLAASGSVWERRIAMLATFHFIRLGEFEDALRIADALLDDDHPLIHKAVGWMLREVGKRDRAALDAFLGARHRDMPRTMLRQAIERLPPADRRAYLARG